MCYGNIQVHQVVLCQISLLLYREPHLSLDIQRRCCYQKLKPTAGTTTELKDCPSTSEDHEGQAQPAPNNSEQIQYYQQGPSVRSAYTDCLEKALVVAWADLQLFTAWTGLTGNTRKSNTAIQLGVARRQNPFYFLFFPGTDKILLTSEVIFMLVQSAANSLNPDMLY